MTKIKPTFPDNYDYHKHGKSLGLCGECEDPKICYKFKICTSLMDAFDISTFETEGGKLRIIRSKQVP